MNLTVRLVSQNQRCQLTDLHMTHWYQSMSLNETAMLAVALPMPIVDLGEKQLIWFCKIINKADSFVIGLWTNISIVHE